MCHKVLDANRSHRPPHHRPTVEGTFENAGPQMVGNAENTKDAHGAAGAQWIHNRSELTHVAQMRSAVFFPILKRNSDR